MELVGTTIRKGTIKYAYKKQSDCRRYIEKLETYVDYSSQENEKGVRIVVDKKN